MIGFDDANAGVRVAWTLTVALAVGGYFALIVPTARNAGAIEARAYELYRLTNRNERMLSNVNGLHAAGRRVARDVAALAIERDEGASTLAVLKLFALEGKHFHVTFDGFTPGPRAGGSDDGSQDARIALRGTYRNVLAAIADLSKRDVMLEVREIALLQSSDALGLPEIAATIDVTLYRTTTAVMKERSRAAEIDR